MATKLITVTSRISLYPYLTYPMLLILFPLSPPPSTHIRLLTVYTEKCYGCVSFYNFKYRNTRTVKLRIEAPASISTNESDPRPVCGARRLSGARLLSEVLRYLLM